MIAEIYYDLVQRGYIICHVMSCIFLVSYIEERPWWPIPSPNKGKKQKAKRREISSGLLVLDLKYGKLQDSEKEEEGRMFHKLHALGMNDDLWEG